MRWHCGKHIFSWVPGNNSKLKYQRNWIVFTGNSLLGNFITKHEAVCFERLDFLRCLLKKHDTEDKQTIRVPLLTCLSLPVPTNVGFLSYTSSICPFPGLLILSYNFGPNSPVHSKASKNSYVNRKSQVLLLKKKKKQITKCHILFFCLELWYRKFYPHHF